jgi:hypothetical protein
LCGHELRGSDRDITMLPRDEVVARTQHGAHLMVARDHARPNRATDASSPCGIIDSVAKSSRERISSIGAPFIATHPMSGTPNLLMRRAASP